MHDIGNEPRAFLGAQQVLKSPCESGERGHAIGVRKSASLNQYSQSPVKEDRLSPTPKSFFNSLLVNLTFPDFRAVVVLTAPGKRDQKTILTRILTTIVSSC